MEIVMIKKQGCMPCEQFEPDARKIAEDNGIKFRTIPQEIMPAKMRPPYFPYFHLMEGKELLESWGGDRDRKFKSVIKRHTKKKNEKD